MKLETLKDLYILELKDLYSAEKQIIKALPKMVKAASNEKLAAGFKQHLEETKEQALRLEKILKSHGQTTRGPKCKGMEGVLKEGDEMIEEEADEEVRDAGLIALVLFLRNSSISFANTAGGKRKRAHSTRGLRAHA